MSLLPGMYDGGIGTVAVGSRDACKTSIWDQKNISELGIQLT